MIYKVTKDEGDGALSSWEIEADNIEEAQDIVLKDEGYSIALLIQPDMDYSLYYQRSERYKGIKLGNSNLSFQNYGCFTCVLSFMARQDPLVVHELLKKGGAYNGANIISEKAAKILNLDLLKGDDPNIPGKMNDINYMPTFQTVKEVSLGKSQHFVVRLIDNAGKRSIFDPWTGNVLGVNHYPFRSYRLFRVK